MAAMTDKISHNHAQRIPVIPVDRMLKAITAATFLDGDIVELPSHELVRYQLAPPAPEDRWWAMIEHVVPRGQDGELADIGDMGRGAVRSAGWHGGLVAPRGGSVACLLDVDHCDGNHTYLCSACYSHGPEGDGYDPGEGYAAITVLDRGYCEICSTEYATQDDRLIELPEGTLERDELAAKNASLEAQIRERALRAPWSAVESIRAAGGKVVVEPNGTTIEPACAQSMGCLCAHHARGGDPYEGCDASESAEDKDGHDHTFDRLFVARLVVALGLPRDVERVARALAIEPEAVGEYYADAVAEQIVREADAKTKATGPRCPQCGETDRIAISETFTAYHPIAKYEDGHMAVENALATASPSHHFDEGSDNYSAACRLCGYEGSLDEFGLPATWDWV